MSTPTTATATIPPHHYRHHHSHHHAHYPPYPQLQSPVHSASYRNAAAIPSTLPATHVLPSPTGVPPPASTISSSSTSSRHAPASTASYSTYISGPQQPSHRRSANGAAASVASTGAPASRLTHEYHGTDSESASTPRSDANLDNMSIPSSSQNIARKRRRSKGPDWTEFYKNGVPKEVIVIDDTPEPDGDIKDNISSNYSTTTYNTNGTIIGSDTGVSTRHVAKKRKKEDGYVNGGRVVNGSHIATPNSATSSTDRTTSAQNTTAPTSLASLSSNGQYDYEQASATGQKRKRTRQQHAQEAKRRDIEALGDAYISYRPPQKPIKKSAEVAVRVVTDVRSTAPNRFGSTLLTARKRYSNVKVDDEDGHYIVVPDADITQQYQINKLLGQGTFGKVVQARDRKRNKLVAIKIIRSVQKYRDASRIELRVLQTLKANDEENRNRCIHLRDCFDFRGHICIVMDLLGSSVFDFLKSNNFVPFPNSQIQSFARQLLTSVAFLHDLNLIHTDLKPENILLCDNAYQTFTYNRRIPSSSTGTPRQANQRKVLLDTEIRLIDFGSATFEDEYHSSVVSTRHYRAPEIILGLGWSFPCDIWSIGCILVEFFTGDALFQTHDNLEHLAMMENVCDRRIDQHLAQQVTKMNNRSSSSSGNAAAKYFKRLKLDYPTADTTRASRRFVKNMKRLSDIIPSHSPFLRLFLDLLEKIFVYDPARRITARQALDHPWFKEPAIADDGTEAAKIRLERLRADPEYAHSRAPPLSVS
ncbi:Dual specificity protein kinase lkh1 [Apiospora sp. TS-2023a]